MPIFQKRTTFFIYLNVNQHYLILLQKTYHSIIMKPHTDSLMERRTLLLSFPSYGEVKIQVTQRISNRLLSILDLKRVKKFEIPADKKERASILLTVINEDSRFI